MSVSGVKTTNASFTAIPAPAQQSIANVIAMYGIIFFTSYDDFVVLSDAQHVLFDVL
jgi:hypothetical protein